MFQKLVSKKEKKRPWHLLLLQVTRFSGGCHQTHLGLFFFSFLMSVSLPSAFPSSVFTLSSTTHFFSSSFNESLLFRTVTSTSPAHSLLIRIRCPSAALHSREILFVFCCVSLFPLSVHQFFLPSTLRPRIHMPQWCNLSLGDKLQKSHNYEKVFEVELCIMILQGLKSWMEIHTKKYKVINDWIITGWCLPLTSLSSLCLTSINFYRGGKTHPRSKFTVVLIHCT